MEENNNQNKTVIIAVISVLVFAIIVLCGVVFFLLFGKIKGKMQDIDDGKRTEATESKKSYAKKEERKITEEEITEEMEEIEDFDYSDDEETVLDLDGFEFRIPADYGCMITEAIGPVVYMSDIFQIKLVVTETSYDEYMEDPESLTDKVVRAGGTVTREVTETEINGKKYVYYGLELSDEPELVVYTKAGDEDRCFAGQIAILSDSVTEDDLLHVFAQITENATVTDKPNTTADDLMISSSTPGEKKEESSLSIKAGTVTFKVPEGFYSEGQVDLDNDDFIWETFDTKDYEVSVECKLESMEEWGSAKDYYNFDLETAIDCGENVKEAFEVIGGREVDYYISSYRSDNGADFQEIYAVCEVDGMIYNVQAIAIDWDGELTFDMIRDFLVVK